MNTQRDIKKSSRLGIIRGGCLALLMVSLAACSFGLGASESSAPTATPAGDLVATIQADVMATLQAKQTQDAAAQVAPTQAQSVDTQATLQAMQAMLDAQATALAAPAAVQATQPAPVQITAPPASGGALEPIQVSNFAVEFWSNAPYGCDGLAPCWVTNDDFVKHFGGNLLITSRQSYLVDPAWPSPFLVFRDRRDNQADGVVEFLIDGKPVIAKFIPKGRRNWSNEAISLSEYVGKKIAIRFMVPGRLDSNENEHGGTSPSTHWFVAQVQIIPNYQP